MHPAVSGPEASKVPLPPRAANSHRRAQADVAPGRPGGGCVHRPASLVTHVSC